MTEITPMPSSDDWEHPRPGRSTIMFEIVEGDSYLFDRWVEGRLVRLPIEFGEVQHEGGSAAIEAEAGMLEYVIAEMLDDEFCQPGWYVMEGFYGSFTKDYYGDVDCCHEYDLIRPATEGDRYDFGC